MPRQAEYIASLESRYPIRRQAVEIDGHWGTVSGGCYIEFDKDRHTAEAGQVFDPRLPAFAIDETKPLWWTLDFNVAWMCSLVAQWHDQRIVVKRLEPNGFFPPTQFSGPEVDGYQKHLCYVLDEIRLPDAGSPDVGREFVRRYGAIARKTGVYVFGDPAGGHRSQTASNTANERSNWDHIFAALREANIPFKPFIATADPGVLNRVNAQNDQFSTGDGIGCVVDETRCSEYVKDLLGNRWKPGEYVIDKSDKTPEGLKRTHSADAGCYMTHLQQRIYRREPLKLKSWMER